MWRGERGYFAVADNEDANCVAGDFVVAQKVGYEGETKTTIAVPDDFIGRLRQVQLPPRPASNNIGTSEAIVV